MSELILITKKQISETTILSANVDADKFGISLLEAQLRVLEPLLGNVLYDSIQNKYKDLIDNGTPLTGDYDTLYNEYIVPIVKYTALSYYIETGQFRVDNGGIYKHIAEDRELATDTEVSRLADRYRSLADVYTMRYQKWVCDINFAEHKEDNDVKERKINQKFGWYFG